MESIFRVPWDAVGLNHVRAFLSEATDEGIRWEAKAVDPNKPDEPIGGDAIRAAICGLSNSMGGYVVIGATRDRKTEDWSLPGVVFPHTEPTTWLDDVVESLRPRPRTEARIWGLEDERVAAVVQVEPVAIPPCMTAGGQIFERTSGKTVRVTDPLVLARLTERGEQARRNSETGARSILDGFLAGAPLRDQTSVLVKLGLQATGHDPDIASRLFRQSTNERLLEIIAKHLRRDRYTPNTKASTLSRVEQAALSGFTRSGPLVTDPQGGDRVWQVVATWSGSVGVRCEGNDPEIGIGLLFEDIIVPAWRAAAMIVPLIGGYGTSHLVVDARATINTGRGDWPSGNVHGAPLERDLDTPEVDEATLGGLKRELLRSMGYPAWEPELEAT